MTNVDPSVVKVKLAALQLSEKTSEKGAGGQYGMNCNLCHICPRALTRQWIH